MRITKHMQDSIDSQLTALKKDSDYTIEKLKKIESMLEQEYVTKDQYAILVQRVDLLQKIVWGFVGLILTAFVVALINLVING